MMNQRIKQSGKTAQINSMAEQIFLRMCTTAHHGFDASHYPAPLHLWDG